MWFTFGLAPFKQKKPWEPFLEEWLDLHFKGAALHKTDSLTVLITYSFAVCVNILQYHSIYNIIAHWHLPFHSYKMKTQPHTGHRF